MFHQIIIHFTYTYISRNNSEKNRTNKWLAILGLQLPVVANQVSSNTNNITQNNKNIKFLKKDN